MRQWKPQLTVRVWFSLGLILLAVYGIAVLSTQVAETFAQPLAQWDVNLQLYGRLLLLIVLVVLCSVLVYRFLSVLTLSYALDRNGLYITWLGNRAVVPLWQITAIEVGAAAAVPLLARVGYYRGEARLANAQPLYLFATRAPKQALVVHTADAAYAISPREADAFVQDLEQRRRLGVISQLAPTIERGRLFFYEFWDDPLVRAAVFAAVVVNVILFGLLMARYPALIDNIGMRFNATGEIVDVRPRYQVFFLPLAALLVGLINLGLGLTLYARDRVSARLLQFGSVLAQVLFGIALLAILR